MSKKNKQEVVIKNEELKPTVLYTIKEKKVNFIAIILLFAVFIAVIYFLPQLSEMYQEYKKGETSNVTKNPLTPNTNNIKDENDSKQYKFSTNLTITTDDFSISNFSFKDNLLRFEVVNEKSVAMDFRYEYYYLEVYGANDNLITRIKVAEDNFEGSEKKNYVFTVKAESISYFLLKEIKEEEYEDITLNKDSNNNSTLTCEVEGDRLIYNFTNDELNRIAEVKTVLLTDVNYQSELTKYQNQVITYQNYPGIQNNVNVTNENFTYNLLIDLSTANINNLDNIKFYNNKTSPKVVNFEMTSRGYICK